MKRFVVAAIAIASVATGCVTTPTADQMCQSGTPAASCEGCRRAAEEYRRGNYHEVKDDAQEKKRCLEELYKQCKDLLQGSAQSRAVGGSGDQGTCEPPLGLTHDAVANLDLKGLEDVEPETLKLMQQWLRLPTQGVVNSANKAKNSALDSSPGTAE